MGQEEKELQQLITLFLLVATLGAYLFARYLAQRYPNPLCNIIFVGTGLVIAVLLASGQSYEVYGPVKDMITFFLGPATVALAVPVYRNLHLFKKYGWAIITAVGLGTMLTIIVVVGIAMLGGLSHQVIASLAPKSATIPFAIEIARLQDGNPALAAAFVVATGTFGSVLGLEILTRCKIRHPVARGLAMGTVSHGQGTAMAFTEGELQGAMAGVAMAFAGVLTALLVPILLPLMLPLV